MKFLGLNFAHLRGLSARASADEETATAANSEEECEDEEDMQSEQTAAEAEADGAEGDSAKGKDGKKGKAKNAKKKDDETDGDNDDGEGDPDDEENGKKASGSDLRKSFARGRKFERARGTAIFAAPAAANNVELAAKLAFDGEYANLSSAAAIAILEKAGSGKGKGLSSKMEGKSPNLGPSSPKEPDKAKAIDASWEAAAKDFMPAKQ
jgi:hypothetical protein